MDLARTTLISKNITVLGKRTSVRLEPAMWEALQEIAEKENASLNDICSHVHHNRLESSLTSALRVYILTYYRFPKMRSLRPCRENS
ncbi:MAG: ribbon-helix-helix domain-containing protein [Alphaproteobacteria bacterium]|nr:ribbon-helix-helix domain-containing protein [Alphaproteobacteria bacterium]MDP3531793.1 ribbon-helix-helix domain-containing protein [Alphaproteobacteria bacterium]